MKKHFILFLLLAILVPQIISSQSSSSKIDNLIKKYNEYGYFNGSALVADNFNVVLKKGYGSANFEWNIPNAADTKHRIGSITKQFTSMLIMQLVEKGKIKLDGKITDYLPYYRKDTGDKITIEMLLIHTSGIPSYTNRPDFRAKVMRQYYKPDDFVKEFCSGDLEFTPGSKLVYNNSGYFILGAIIEKVMGITYAEALQKNIFDPLGMKNSGYDTHDPILLKRATGYERQGNGYVNSEFLDMSLPYAAGSMYSTVEDLLIWDKALQTEKLASKKTLDEIFYPRVDGLGAKYGYGWLITKTKIKDVEYDVVTHGGGINGFNTINYIIPKKGQVVVLFSNAGGAPLNEMTTKIIDLLNGKEAANPPKSLVNTFAELLDKEGIEKATAKFMQMKELKEEYRLREADMNTLGYSYLGKNQIEKALAVFKLNIEAFPKSANVYDSYGEALLKKGLKEEAITNYKKAFELDPKNAAIAKTLKDLGVNVETTKDADVSQEVLNSYVGKYQLAPNFIIEITVADKHIYAQATGQPKFEIFPESETKFYLKVVEAKVEFIKENGKVTKLILNQGGREMPASKIE